MPLTVKEVDGVDLAFGPARINTLLPAWDEIPDEFKRHNNKWVRIVSRWFFQGLKGATFKPKPGVDERKALNHIGACMKSWEPQHEHKEAGCAYLLSEFFEDVILPDGK